MKKLKIFLPILLISLFFIPKVNASVSISDYDTTIVYSDSFINTINNNQERIDNLIDYMSNVNVFRSYTLSDNHYIIGVLSNTMSTNTWRVWIINFNNVTDKENRNPPFFNSVFTSINDDQSNRRLNFQAGCIRYDFTFTDNNISSYSYVSSSSYCSRDFLYSTGQSPITENVTLEYSDTYFITEFMNDTYNFSYPHVNSSGTWYELPISINDVSYVPSVLIPTKEFFDSLLPNPNPYKCSVEVNGFDTSSLSNISDFEYRITAENLSSQDYGIEGSFAFQNSSFTFSDNNFYSADYWEAQIIKGPNSVGEYNVNGVFSWDNTTKVLTINYGVYATGNEPAKVDVIIKIIPKSHYSEDYFGGTLNYYSCNPVNPNISFVDSYGYTDNTTGLSNSYDTSLMNFLNSSSNPDLQFFNNIKTLLPTGPVDSILTIPLQMLNSINNFLGSNCTPLTLNLPYVNRNVELKCIRSFYTDIGATTWVESVGAVASVILLVNYFTYLYNWVEDVFRLSHKNLKTWGTGEL